MYVMISFTLLQDLLEVPMALVGSLNPTMSLHLLLNVRRNYYGATYSIGAELENANTMLPMSAIQQEENDKEIG